MSTLYEDLFVNELRKEVDEDGYFRRPEEVTRTTEESEAHTESGKEYLGYEFNSCDFSEMRDNFTTEFDKQAENIAEAVIKTAIQIANDKIENRMDRGIAFIENGKEEVEVKFDLPTSPSYEGLQVTPVEIEPESITYFWATDLGDGTFKIKIDSKANASEDDGFKFGWQIRVPNDYRVRCEGCDE